MQTLSVIRWTDVWTIVAQGKRLGRFAYRVDAEEAVLRLAARSVDEGQTVEVLIQNAWGEMRPLNPIEPNR